MLQPTEWLSASSSRPNDSQLRRSASGSTHNIDIEVEPPVCPFPLSHSYAHLTLRQSHPQFTSDRSNSHALGFLSPNHTPAILVPPPEPPEHRPVIPAIPMDNGPSTKPPPCFMPYPSIVISRSDESPKMIPSAGWGMNDWGNLPTSAAD